VVTTAETPTASAVLSRWEPTAETTSTVNADNFFYTDQSPLLLYQWRLDENHHAGRRATLLEIGARISFFGVCVSAPLTSPE
jgi:hypothetical protein